MDHVICINVEPNYDTEEKKNGFKLICKLDLITCLQSPVKEQFVFISVFSFYISSALDHASQVLAESRHT